MGNCVGCQYWPKKSWSGHTWGDYFKTHDPEITRGDHYGPPLDLAGVKLEEVDTSDIQQEVFQLHSQACLSIHSSNISFCTMSFQQSEI